MIDVRIAADALETKLTSLGLSVGDAVAPTGSPPYVVLYPIAGGGTSGPLGALHDDAALVYQVTCVGTSREQAQWLENKVNAILGTETYTIPGHRVLHVDHELPGGVREDPAKPGVFYSTPQFRVYSTPS